MRRLTVGSVEAYVVVLEGSSLKTVPPIDQFNFYGLTSDLVLPLRPGQGFALGANWLQRLVDIQDVVIMTAGDFPSMAQRAIRF